jgi:Legionella pneumophila major outer membrane protein precursor
MLRTYRMLLVAAIVLGVRSAALAQGPESLPVPVAPPPQQASPYPPGVVDVTPDVLPGPAGSGSPQCYFIPAHDAVAPFVVSVEYLLLRPYRRDLDYAIVDPNGNLTPEGHIANLDWQTRSGVRAGLMWRPRDSSSDLSFTYTYAYSQDTANIAAPAGGVLFPTLTRPGIIDAVLTAQAFSSITYNVFDIDVGHRFNVDNSEYRIFAGFRIADIGQVLAATYDGLDAHQALARNHVCMNGGGLTLGGEAHWCLARGFGAYARGRGSLVVGDYCVSNIETDFAGNVVNTDVRDSFTKVVPVLDLAAGVSWQHRNMRASIGYEINHWFNQVEGITFLDDFSVGKHGRTQSDLSLEAIVFQFAIDF